MFMFEKVIRSSINGVLFGVLLLCASSLQIAAQNAGRTFYVATGGSDGNAGTTPAAPLATIQRGLDLAVKPGDTVIVGDGVYRERGVAFRASGTTAQPITLKAQNPGRRAILDMSLPVPTWTLDGGSIYKGRPTLRNSADREPELLNGAMRVVVDGKPLVQVRSRERLREGTFYFAPQIDPNNRDNNTGDYYVWAFGGVNPATVPVVVVATLYYSFYPSVAVRDTIDNVAIEGLVIQGGASGISANRPEGGVHGRGLTIRNSEIVYNWTYALELARFDDVRMENSVVRDNAQNNWHRRLGIKPFGDPESNWPHAIIGFDASNVKILDSRIHDNHGEGVGPYFGNSNWEMSRNIVFDNWSVNVYIDTNRLDANTTVDRNFVYQTDKYTDLARNYQPASDEIPYDSRGNNYPDGIRICSEIPAPGGGDPVVGGITITNNVVQDTGGGIRSFRYGAPFPNYSLTDSLIANNTIVGGRATFGTTAEPGIWVQRATNTRVINNIIAEAPANVEDSRVVVSNNLLYQNAYVNGFDSMANVFADPRFTTGRGDGIRDASFFQLRFGSPAINAGTCQNAPAVDFFGRTRTGICDIGAFEYLNTPPTVSIASPTNNTVFNAPADILIRAAARDAEQQIGTVEFFANGTKIGDSENTLNTFNWRNIAAGTYALTVKATDSAGASTISAPVNITVSTAPPTGTGNGLKAEYFNNKTLSGASTLTRTDATVNFDWANSSPDASIPNDNFSARWTGQVQATVTGNYTFSTVSDDGVRLYINNQLVINNWTDHGATTDTTVSTPLTSGQKYDVRMEFYENGGQATAKLLWTPPNASAVVIPQTQLYSSATPTLDLPNGWLTGDVGSVGQSGAATFSNNAFNLKGSGADIWNSSDGFRFVYQTVSGARGYTLTARVVSQINTNPWAKAGVMIRQSLNANSAHAMTVQTPANGTAFQRRLTAGASSAHTPGARLPNPVWVRIRYTGGTAKSYTSTDGVTWTQIGTAQTLSLTQPLQIGLVVTSHDNTRLSEAVFNNVTIESCELFCP